MYACCACSYQFVRRYHRQPAWVARAYVDYTQRRHTLTDVSRKYGKDPKTLRKYFDDHAPVTGEILVPRHPVAAVLDATFFSKTDGLLVCRAERQNLLWQRIASETVEAYQRLLEALDAAGVRFTAFTIDGRRGVRQMLTQRYPGIPVQHCHFHQLQTVTQQLTRRPQLQASRELRRIALALPRTTRPAFTTALDAWYEQWSDFLKERTFSTERKRQWRYTHERLRSAYFSLRRNLPWLFTCQEYPELSIPNTTNSCDGSFSHWKSKVTLHRGLAKNRRDKMVDFLLEQS